MDEWTDLAGWWYEEIADDPAFSTDIVPLLEALMPARRGPWLDAGCGEGRVARLLGDGIVGCDLSAELLRRAAATHPVVQCRLPDLRWLRDGSLDGVYIVLSLEHIADLDGFLAEAHRCVATGGALVVVANHPAFTAEGAAPIVDLTDGEVLWRWGPYFTPAPVATDIVAGRTVTFHHRPLGMFLTAAAAAGWSLRVLDERPLSPAALAGRPDEAQSAHLPRLLGARWEKR